MYKNLLPLLLCTPALVVCSADLASSDEQPFPPYRKKALSTEVGAHEQFDPSFVVLNTTPAIPFSATGVAVNDNAPDSELSVPSPATGVASGALVNGAGWVGSAQWHELQPGKSAGDSSSGVFVGAAIDAPELTWTPSSPGMPSPNALQMPQVAPQVGRSIPPQRTLVASGADGGTTPNAARVEVLEPSLRATVSISTGAEPTQVASSDNLPVSGSAPAEFIQGGKQIILPDLSGESESVVPTKKSPDPVAQTHSNSQTGAPNFNTGPGASNNLFSPGANNAAMPAAAPSLNIGGAGAGASISATGSKFHYESEDYLANVGLEYVSPKASYGVGLKASAAALLGKTYAIGTNLTFNQTNEAVINAVWMPENTNVKAKLSAAYMWGQQNFDFYSGNANASLTQASYYFSTQYVVPKERSDYLHSIGASTWGSKAKQTNNPNPVYVTTETASAYNIMMDPLKLAVGTLQGEALDAQVGITKQVITKASMGYESLKFPFSDGTQELNKRLYQDYVVQYQPIPELSLQAGYKVGAALSNAMLSAAYGQWRLTGFKNTGNNGVAGSQGIMLAYSIPLDGKVSTPTNVLTRPELIGNGSYILRDAAVRPVQLPQTFLAKVDTTAVTMLASILKSGLQSGTTVNSQGQVLVNVGSGNGTITGVTRNGATYAYASTIFPTVSGLMIDTLKLPAAASGGDAYIVSMTDSGGATYFVNFTTQN